MKQVPARRKFARFPLEQCSWRECSWWEIDINEDIRAIGGGGALIDDAKLSE